MRVRVAVSMFVKSVTLCGSLSVCHLASSYHTQGLMKQEVPQNTNVPCTVQLGSDSQKKKQNKKSLIDFRSGVKTCLVNRVPFPLSPVAN